MTINNNKYFTYNPHLSNGDASCENLLIQGDNKLVLQQLAPIFNGKIKCIYIDPPYNSGKKNSFGYNDNFNHSSWLTFMKNRLELFFHVLVHSNPSLCRLFCTEMYILHNIISLSPFTVNEKPEQEIPRPGTFYCTRICSLWNCSVYS